MTNEQFYVDHIMEIAEREILSVGGYSYFTLDRLRRQIRDAYRAGRLAQKIEDEAKPPRVPKQKAVHYRVVGSGAYPCRGCGRCDGEKWL